jgi:hypothetical protein
MGAICEGLRVTVSGFKEKFVRELAALGLLFYQYPNEIETGRYSHQGNEGVATQWQPEFCARDSC